MRRLGPARSATRAAHAAAAPPSTANPAFASAVATSCRRSASASALSSSSSSSASGAADDDAAAAAPGSPAAAARAASSLAWNAAASALRQSSSGSTHFPRVWLHSSVTPAALRGARPRGRGVPPAAATASFSPLCGFCAFAAAAAFPFAPSIGCAGSVCSRSGCRRYAPRSAGDAAASHDSSTPSHARRTNLGSRPSRSPSYRGLVPAGARRWPYARRRRSTASASAALNGAISCRLCDFGGARGFGAAGSRSGGGGRCFGGAFEYESGRGRSAGSVFSKSFGAVFSRHRIASSAFFFFTSASFFSFFFSAACASAAAATSGRSGSIFAQNDGSSRSRVLPPSVVTDACEKSEPPPAAARAPLLLPAAAAAPSGAAASSAPKVRVSESCARISSIDLCFCVSVSSRPRSWAPERRSASICSPFCFAVASSGFSWRPKPVAVSAFSPWSPWRMTACSRPSFWLEFCSIAVSYVPLVQSLYTCTGFVWPMRWQRAIAWMSF